MIRVVFNEICISGCAINGAKAGASVLVHSSIASGISRWEYDEGEGARRLR